MSEANSSTDSSDSSAPSINLNFSGVDAVNILDENPRDVLVSTPEIPQGKAESPSAPLYPVELNVNHGDFDEAGRYIQSPFDQQRFFTLLSEARARKALSQDKISFLLSCLQSYQQRGMTPKKMASISDEARKEVQEEVRKTWLGTHAHVPEDRVILDPPAGLVSYLTSEVKDSFMMDLRKGYFGGKGPHSVPLSELVRAVNNMSKSAKLSNEGIWQLLLFGSTGTAKNSLEKLYQLNNTPQKGIYLIQLGLRSKKSYKQAKAELQALLNNPQTDSVSEVLLQAFHLTNSIVSRFQLPGEVEPEPTLNEAIDRVMPFLESLFGESAMEELVREFLAFAKTQQTDSVFEIYLMFVSTVTTKFSDFIPEDLRGYGGQQRQRGTRGVYNNYRYTSNLSSPAERDHHHDQDRHRVQGRGTNNGFRGNGRGGARPRDGQQHRTRINGCYLCGGEHSWQYCDAYPNTTPTFGSHRDCCGLMHPHIPQLRCQAVQKRQNGGVTQQRRTAFNPFLGQRGGTSSN